MTAEAPQVGELIDRLAETERALAELLQGQADAVLTPGGRMLLLRSAQERLTHDEEVQRCAAALQRGILDGLPANIALLNRKGVIVSVNATWRQFALENGHAGREAAVGGNYLTVCDAVQGEEREQAIAAAAGIRQVLVGARPMFSMEYPCHSPTVRRWFRMTATPLPDVAGGAVVMHLDVTEEQEGRQALDRMFNLSLDMLSIVGFDGSFKRVNSAFERVLGYPEAELLRGPYMSFVHPDDVERTVQAAARLAAGEDISFFENRYRCRDGRDRWFQWACRSFPSEKIIYSVTRDVTEQKHAIDVLRQSEAHLALAQKVAGLGSWNMEWHAGHRRAEHLRWSDETYRILGLQPGEIEPSVEAFYEFLAPADREQADEALLKAFETHGRYSLEHRIILRDGTARIVHGEGETFPLPDAPEMLQVAGVLQDVTERRHAEREQARLAAIVESSDDAIIGTDLQGLVTSWNSGATALLGFTAEEMLGQPIILLSAEERHSEQAWIFERIARGEPVRHLETERRGKDGRPVSVSITVSPIRDGSNRIVGASKIVRDITERKQAQLALEAAQRRLVAASRQAGMAEVASNVLHNVGNVLNGVNISAELVSGIVRGSSVANLGRVAGLLKEHAHELPAYLATHPQGRQLPGYLELLARHLADEQANALRELDSLRRSIDHIKEVIAHQQDHAGRGGVITPVAAAEIMEDALRITATALQLHGIRLVRRFAEPLELRTDKHQVLQILVNLLRNACDALRESAPGARVLTAEIERINEQRLAFVVTDNGPGIAPENLPRLFEHGFTTRKTGHGFGLHSAALLAQDLGGTIAAASAGPGHGATFRLELPLEGARRNQEA